MQRPIVTIAHYIAHHPTHEWFMLEAREWMNAEWDKTRHGDTLEGFQKALRDKLENEFGMPAQHIDIHTQERQGIGVMGNGQNVIEHDLIVFRTHGPAEMFKTRHS